MIEFLQEHQLSIMLFLSGVCFILALLALLTKTLSPKRRRALVSLETAAMLLLIFDRFAYIYRGSLSSTGFWMVRISNFFVFFFTILITHYFNLYLIDLCRNEGKMTSVPKRLIFCELLFAAGSVLIIISQFTGLYYYFDEQNLYHRAPGYFICLVIPLIILFLQLTVIFQYRKHFRNRIAISLFLFGITPLAASVLQYFAYGLSLTNISIVGMAIILYIFALLDLNDSLEMAKRHEIDILKNEQKRINNMFEQTAESLATAIDAKDQYTHGHSSRVAEYSERIARAAGKSEEECQNIFFAALLHDVGKIGIPDSIITKKGRLTDEEFGEIKKHPVVGRQILSRISESPYLSIGAHYHHERYGGGGYPDGLKGEEIPEIARIIAVADAYDAMTSNRSYRNAIPQHIVREELIKGTGTQFDPEFAKIMINMLDHDTDYRMQETESGESPSCPVGLRCESIYHDCTDGFAVTRNKTRIRLCSYPDEGVAAEESLPSLILYDSLDGAVHPGMENSKEVLYFEYARIRLDGTVTAVNIRNHEVRIFDQETDIERPGFGEPEREQRYKIEAVRYKDHALIRISDTARTIQIILALPDSTRFSYISISGENCYLHNILSENDDKEIGPDAIPRIAEEISFIKDCPEGDIPNLQIDGWRTAISKGILLSDHLTLSFHFTSLPTARLVWHCPFLSVYSSADGRHDGADFREYFLLRLDGENWESNEHVKNVVQVNKTEAFKGWNEWIETNKKGLDCAITIEKRGQCITMNTENQGIAVSSVTTILDDVKDIYVALTGDQCAITNIRM